MSPAANVLTLSLHSYATSRSTYCSSHSMNSRCQKYIEYVRTSAAFRLLFTSIITRTAKRNSNVNSTELGDSGYIFCLLLLRQNLCHIYTV